MKRELEQGGGMLVVDAWEGRSQEQVPVPRYSECFAASHFVTVNDILKNIVQFYHFCLTSFLVADNFRIFFTDFIAKVFSDSVCIFVILKLKYLVGEIIMHLH